MNIAPLPISYTLEQFRQVTPLDESKVWEFIYDRHGGRIHVKRREVALENIKKIFLATFRCANNIGFRAMSLRDLCRETGLSMGGLYGYIESKDQIADMTADLVYQMTEMTQSWFEQIASPQDKLECILRAHVFLGEIFQPWLYFVFLESRSLQAGQRELIKAAEYNIQGHVCKAIAMHDNFSDKKAMLLAAHCVSLVQDWYLKPWKYRAAGLSADQCADSVVRLLRSAMAKGGGNR